MEDKHQVIGTKQFHISVEQREKFRFDYTYNSS